MTKNLIKDYLKVIREQNKYPFIKNYDFLIVTDDALAIYPYIHNLHNYKNYNIYESKLLFTNGFHNLSIGKNIGINYAIQNNYNWLFICDADVVIFKDFKFSKNGFIVSQWIKLEKNIFDPLKSLNTLTPSSMYLLNKNVFSKLRYYEDYYGHGWEDMDFFWIERRKHNIECSMINNNCLHLYHDLRTFYLNSETLTRNELIFTERFMDIFDDYDELKKILNK